MNNNQHSVVSGGGSGLGHGLAIRLLARGANVSILDLAVNDQNHQSLNAAATRGNSQWHFSQVDITNADIVNGAVTDAVERFGDIQLAINSAGVAVNKLMTETSPEDFQRVVNINLTGSFNFAKAVLPTMKPGARLALLASMAGFIGNYGYTAYSASKFGVVGLANTLRNEYEPLGVHISCVCPPEVKTPMVEAEHASGNAISLELKKAAGTITIDDACDYMLAALHKGKWLVVPGRQARFLLFLNRYFSAPFAAINRQLIKRLMRKGL